MKNIEIRMALMKAGIKQYTLAAKMNVTETKLSKMLRAELPQEEKQKIIDLITNKERGVTDGNQSSN